MNIEYFSLNNLKYEDKTDDTRAFIQNILTISNVNLTYELDSDLEEYRGEATIVIWISGLEFYVSVERDHATGTVTPAVSFYNIGGGAFKMHIFHFPNNAYTQLIAKEVKACRQIQNSAQLINFQIKTPGSKTFLQDQLKESFKQWKNLPKFLALASEEIPFPNICFTCT